MASASGTLSRSRARDRQRLLEAVDRLEENHQVEIQANDAYEAWWAERRAGRVPGQKLGMPPRPVDAPVMPEGVMNKTDPDSRMMRTQGQPTIQGYNAQAAVTRGQIIVAAEIAVESPDFGHLEPAVGRRCASSKMRASSSGRRRCSPTLVTGTQEQMENIVSRRNPGAGPSRRRAAERHQAGLGQRPLRVHASECSQASTGHELYKHRKATVEPVFAQNKFNRRIDDSNDEAEPPPFGMAAAGSQSTTS